MNMLQRKLLKHTFYNINLPGSLQPELQAFLCPNRYGDNRQCLQPLSFIRTVLTLFIVPHTDRQQTTPIFVENKHFLYMPGVSA